MRYLLLVLGLFVGSAVFAQTSTTFIIPDTTADNNTEMCLPIRVIDFTGGVEFGFSIRWDTPDNGGALDYTRVRNFNPEINAINSFTAANVDDVTYVAAGLITAHWAGFNTEAECNIVPTATLDDQSVLFEICFDVLGPVASQHPVTLFDKPDDDPFDGVDDSAEVIFNKRAQCGTGNDAYPGTDNGSVTIGVKPLVLTVQDDNGIYLPGDTYCVDVVAESGFEELRGYQFGLQYDNTVLRSISASANTDLPQNNDSGYRIFGGQAFFGSWNKFGGEPETLPDGTTLVTVCFEIIGDCRDRTTISVGPVTPDANGERPIEAIADGAGDTQLILPIITDNDVRLIVDNCNPNGFDVRVECPSGTVNFGDTEVCVEIQAGDDFIEMTDIDYLVNWDPGVLEFVDVRSFNSSLFINRGNHFDESQVGNGTLAFDWESPGALRGNLNPGDVVYEVCFNAIGFGGTSPIVIADFMNDIRSATEGRFVGVNPSNCAITIQKPDGVAVDFPDNIGFSATQDGCFDLEVDGFSDVVSFELNIIVPNGLFDFAGFTAAIPGVTFNEIGGILQIIYNAGGGEPVLNLADGTSLGSICYRADADADPADCGPLSLATFFPSTVITEESAGNSVPVESLDGEACVLFPNGFGLIIGDAMGFVNDEVCVPVSVTRFTDITSANINFNFDPSRLTFDRVDFSGPWTGLSGANVDNSGAAIGEINIDWSTNAPNGLNIVDTDTVQVFEICFQAGAEDNPCVDISAEDGADPVVTTATAPGSIVYSDGTICLEDRLVLTNITAIDASCDDNDDGMILFEVEPRADNQDIIIRTDNPVRFGNNGSVEGLLPGMTNYTIYTANGILQLSGTIMIGVNPDSAAVSMAGEDQTLSCGENSVAVINGRGNVGETYTLFILQGDGTTRRVAEGDVSTDGTGNVVASVSEAGTYYLDVISSAGCTDRDTVVVVGQDQPLAEANEGDQALVIDCNNNGVTLNCAGSSTGDDVTYLWERINGLGDPLEVVGVDCETFIERGGRYRLTVTFATRQCSSTDVVLVRDERVLPNSVLPTQASLSCDGSELTVSVGPEEDNVDIEWTRLNESTVIGTANELTISQTGTYVASLLNSTTGCGRMDTISVLPSTGVPAISAPPATDLVMPCNPDTLVLSPTYGNISENSSYIWKTDDGRVVITDGDDPTPRVVLPGTYRVIVGNGDCRDSLDIVVTESIFPTVEAGQDTEIACQSTFQLSGDGETTAAESLSYQWTVNGMDVPMGAAASVVVDQPGTYYLTVTGDESGCSATDSIVLSAPNGFPEYQLADTIGGLGCDGSSVRLAADDPQGDYEYVWADPNGEEISTSATARADVSGIYSVTITNPATNCQAVDQVFVDDDAAELPFVAFRQNTLDISCDNGPAIIDAEPSVDGNQYTYTWENVVGGETPAEQGNDTLVVRTAGTYRLTLFNTVTRCENFREVTVTDSRAFPNVEAVTGETLDCDTRMTIIGINILDQPNDYSISWSAPPVVTDDLPDDTTRIAVTIGGTYNAVIINNQSSCTTTIPIRVEDLIDSIATLTIMTPDAFDCNNSTVTIDASGTELNNATADGIVWTSFNGNNINPATGSLIVSVDGAGDYELAVTDATGCTVRDTVTVMAAEDTPFAQATEQVETDCGGMPQLDGSASTPAPGGNIIYAWSTDDGGILSGGDGPRPFVEGPGTYQLVVTNIDNGCADTAFTQVVLSEQAAASIDLASPFTTCETSLTVTANLPAGASGVWTAFNDDCSAWTAEQNTVTISDLCDGLSLVWTLSAGVGCENYSADTVRISPEEAPNANDDLLEVGGNNTVGQIDVKINDQRSGPVTVRLLGQPSFGEILSNLNGDITFEAPLGATDVTAIDYELCSNACPTSCDTATLRIRSSADGAEFEVYNAISPNGDGMNDRFIFQVLDLRPNDFPDNELIIFNRWGDILYEAAPYNNDWDGTNSDGTLVPEGTYYYILRLDIGQGEIVRGDVTVVR